MSEALIILFAALIFVAGVLLGLNLGRSSDPPARAHGASGSLAAFLETKARQLTRWAREKRAIAAAGIDSTDNNTIAEVWESEAVKYREAAGLLMQPTENQTELLVGSSFVAGRESRPR